MLKARQHDSPPGAVRPGYMLAVVTAFLFLCGLRSQAAEVRASFLMDREVVSQTVQVLTNSGCTSAAATAFQRMVQRYSATGLNLDLGKFPRLHEGFYTFASAAQLAAALPHPLSETQHVYEFNCFDMVILLAGESLHTTVRPDDIAGPFLAPYTPTNGSFRVSPRATARDAFTVVYPQWYREVSEPAFPQAQLDSRICLTAALFRCHPLPQSTTEESLPDAVMKVLRASWGRLEMKFPANFEVVQCHEVSFPEHFLVTAHLGLLFPRKHGFTYIDKGGGSGPFVRLDFEDRTELITWLKSIFKGGEKYGYTHHYATFNDGKIELLESVR